MSVTFWCPDAPIITVTPFEDDPEYVLEQSVLPEVSLSNANARAALEMLGLPDESLEGMLPAAKLQPCIERLQQFLSEPVQRAFLLEPTVVNDQVVADVGQQASSTSNLTQAMLVPGAGRSLDALLHEARTQRKATVISMGRDDEYLTDLATRLLNLLIKAQAHGYDVHWG